MDCCVIWLRNKKRQVTSLGKSVFFSSLYFCPEINHWLLCYFPSLLLNKSYFWVMALEFQVMLPGQVKAMWLVQWFRKKQFTFQNRKLSKENKTNNKKICEYKWIDFLKLFSFLTAISLWPQKINAWDQEKSFTCVKK